MTHTAENDAGSWARGHALATGHTTDESLTDPGSCRDCSERSPAYLLHDTRTEKQATPRSPRPCSTCGRMGLCADCCCVHPSHRRRWPSPAECPLCRHATR
jgi:hypothetical protein